MVRWVGVVEVGREVRGAEVVVLVVEVAAAAEEAVGLVEEGGLDMLLVF